MSRFGYLAGLCLAGGLVLSPTARADLYGAEQAYDKKDFALAFALYREIAEMGHPLGQESLAVMYVNGEGVKRDNALGYGWAVIARENGDSDIAQNIISQIEPHMTDAARKRVAELQAQFGKAALTDRLIPEVVDPAAKSATPPNSDGCTFLRPANPDTFHPREAPGLSGNVMLEYTVMPDGRARNPRVIVSLPTLTFDAAGANVIFNSTFKPKKDNGVAVPCSMRVRVKFVSMNGTSGTPDLRAALAGAREKALAGDPSAQLAYALLLEALASIGASAESPLAWYVKAAQAGLPVAQARLGSSLSTSIVPGNERKGLAWLNKAADAGQIDAQADLAIYLLGKSPDAAARTRAFDLLDRAATGGSSDAKYRLAALIASDADETRRNPRRALELLEPLMIARSFDPTAWEIHAAANAMIGDFKAAQDDQKRAIRMAAKYGWDLAPQKARLERYENNTAWTGDLLSL